MWPPSILCRHVCPQTDYFTLSSARPSFEMEIWRASCPFFTGAKDRCYKGISWTRASEQEGEGAEGPDRKALQFPQSPQILSRPPSSLAREDPLCLVLHKRGIVSCARGFLGSHYSERKFDVRSPQLKDIACCSQTLHGGSVTVSGHHSPVPVTLAVVIISWHTSLSRLYWHLEQVSQLITTCGKVGAVVSAMASNKSHRRNAGTWEVRGQQRRRNKFPACKGISSVGLMKGNPPKENWDKATRNPGPCPLELVPSQGAGVGFGA